MRFCAIFAQGWAHLLSELLYPRQLQVGKPRKPHRPNGAGNALDEESRRHAIRGSWFTVGDLPSTGPASEESAWALKFGTLGPVLETKDILKIWSALKPHVQLATLRISV